MIKPTPKSRAADNAALRARRKQIGLVQWRPWVTPEEKASLILWLAVVRDNKRGIDCENEYIQKNKITD
jgi:hypothetical protein